MPDLVSTLWREIQIAIEIRKESLTFEKTLPFIVNKNGTLLQVSTSYFSDQKPVMSQNRRAQG